MGPSGFGPVTGAPSPLVRDQGREGFEFCDIAVFDGLDQEVPISHH